MAAPAPGAEFRGPGFVVGWMDLADEDDQVSIGGFETDDDDTLSGFSSIGHVLKEDDDSSDDESPGEGDNDAGDGSCDEGCVVDAAAFTEEPDPEVMERKRRALFGPDEIYQRRGPPAAAAAADSSDEDC